VTRKSTQAGTREKKSSVKKDIRNKHNDLEGRVVCYQKGRKGGGQKRGGEKGAEGDSKGRGARLGAGKKEKKTGPKTRLFSTISVSKQNRT